MYIHPNTTIRLLKGVPLDNTYTDTLYFTSRQAQQDHFGNYTAKSFTQQTYQRVNKGVLRVQVNADEIYDYNYLSFRNTAYGNKQFYAFITSIEYINDAVSEITYEIDVMQTWMIGLDYTLGQCFVEREHSQTDEIGDNIIPEVLPTGELVMNDYEDIFELSELCVVIAIVDVTQGTADGTLYDGIYGGATLWAYESSDTTGINAKIDEYKIKPDAIVSMYMCPLKFMPSGRIPDNHKIPETAYSDGLAKTIGGISDTDTIDGHPVRNKKLFTYPYNFYHIDNGSSGELSLRYEFFTNHEVKLRVDTVMTQPVSCVLRPIEYKGSGELYTFKTLNTECVKLEGYPMCSWNTDAFKAWLAQNSFPMVVNAMGGVAHIVANNLTAPTGRSGADNRNRDWRNRDSALTILNGVNSVVNQVYNASIQADIVKGSYNNGGVNCANGKQTFFGGRCSVSKQFAEMIDDYFTIYGYAVKRSKIPNVNARERWTYTKTIGCTATGSLPVDDMDRVKSIFDNGVTFWKNADDIGKYYLPNNPII